MIVIPMAGLSRRFTEAGYLLPKYMLEAHGRSLFDLALLSFQRYFAEQPFLFVVRDVADTPRFVEQRCLALGIAHARCVPLAAATRGQAETVVLGLEAAQVAPDVAITIFNIDTFRPNFVFPADLAGADGFLEVFEGEGSNWSFARPEAAGSDRVIKTTEKVPISRFCCTGLYHFARAALFERAYAAETARDHTMLQGGELYVAPLYNHLIGEGCDIRMSLIARDEVVFCGVPAEYDEVRAAPPLY